MLSSWCTLSNMAGSSYLKDGTGRRLQQNQECFVKRRVIILAVMMVPCVLLSVDFYISIYERDTILPVSGLLSSSHTKYNLDTSKNTDKHDRRGYYTRNSHSPIHNLKITGTFTREQRLPQCLIIGVMKGGTTSVRSFLSIHPNIVCLNVETNFFTKDENYNRGLEYYRTKMPYSYPDQITVEKTPGYFVTEKAVKRIYAFDKKIKLILTLRHPIKRLISNYEHKKRGKYELENRKRFEELVINETGGINLNYRPVNNSLYFIHLHFWLKYFPKEQIHVVDGDNFIDNPVEEIKKIETFLGLPHKVTRNKVFFNQTKGYYCFINRNKPTCVKGSKGHVFDPIDPVVYHKLFDFYKGYNEKLFTLLGRTFKWDREY